MNIMFFLFQHSILLNLPLRCPGNWVESVEIEPSEKYGAGHSATTSTTSCKICKYFTFASYFYILGGNIHFHFLVVSCIFLFSTDFVEK